MCSRFCALGFVLWVLCFGFGALGLVRGSIYLAADLTARLRCVNIPRSRKRRSDARGVACPGLRRSKCSNRARANCSNAHECASIHVSVVRRGNCAESAISIDPTSISRASHVDPTWIPRQSPHSIQNLQGSICVAFRTLVRDEPTESRKQLSTEQLRGELGMRCVPVMFRRLNQVRQFHAQSSEFLSRRARHKPQQESRINQRK